MNEIKIEQLSKGYLITYMEDRRAISNIEGLFKEIRSIFCIEDFHNKHINKTKTVDPIILDESVRPDPICFAPPKIETCKVYTDIDPFTEIPAFTYSTSLVPIQIGKTKVYVINEKVILYRESYSLNLYTTLSDIKRLKSLPLMDLKLCIQDYEKRTYPNKGVVLRQFLRDLSDMSELAIPETVRLDKPKIIPSFSTMKEVDELQKR